MCVWFEPCTSLISHPSILPHRSGIFLASELEDFELFLLRLSRIGGIMQDNFPMQSYKSSGGWDFHSHFIHYCLEHGLQHLLYVYLDYYRWVLRAGSHTHPPSKLLWNCLGGEWGLETGSQGKLELLTLLFCCLSGGITSVYHVPAYMTAVILCVFKTRSHQVALTHCVDQVSHNLTEACFCL